MLWYLRVHQFGEGMATTMGYSHILVAWQHGCQVLKCIRAEKTIISGPNKEEHQGWTNLKMAWKEPMEIFLRGTCNLYSQELTDKRNEELCQM